MRFITWTEPRSLLYWGMVAGPFYLTVGLAQALMRDGFDLARHCLSVLANGAGGWVQTANLALSGLMVIAAAIGVSNALRPQSRAAGWILACFGIGMFVSAVFPADPVDYKESRVLSSPCVSARFSFRAKSTRYNSTCSACAAG